MLTDSSFSAMQLITLILVTLGDKGDILKSPSAITFFCLILGFWCWYVDWQFILSNAVDYFDIGYFGDKGDILKSPSAITFFCLVGSEWMSIVVMWEVYTV